MKKQTAVDIIREKLLNEFGFTYSDNIHNEIKQIEYNQIIEAHYWGGDDRKESKDPFRNNALNYYHKTFDL
jgi:hypothetical protein